MNGVLTWQDVFDINKRYNAGCHITTAVDFVSDTGYLYFTWNGHIYELTFDENLYKDTGFLVKDLD